VTHFLAEVLSAGVADAGVMRGESSPRVTLRRGEIERVVPRDSIPTFADLMEQAEAAGSAIEGEIGQRTVRRLVAAFYHPTIVPDLPLTTARREQLRASVDPVRYIVRAGDRIVEAQEPVTDEARTKLAALYDEMHRRGADRFWLRGAVGAIMYSLIVLGAFWLLLMFYRRETYAEARQLMFFGGLFILVLLMTAGLNQLFPGRPELIPIPFAAIVVTMLYNGRIGIFAALTLTILLSGQWGLRDSDVLLFGLVGGVAGAIGIRVVGGATTCTSPSASSRRRRAGVDRRGLPAGGPASPSPPARSWAS
jgi:membrane-associated HD superfamily phosphohydrolase